MSASFLVLSEGGKKEVCPNPVGPLPLHSRSQDCVKRSRCLSERCSSSALRNECVSDALQPTTVVAPSGDNGSLRGQGLGRCALATYGINVTVQLRGVEFQNKDQFSVHRTAKTLFLGCVNPPRLRPRITQPRKSIFADLYKGNAWVSQLYKGPGYLLNTWGWACV